MRKFLFNRKPISFIAAFIALTSSANASDIDEFYFSGIGKRIPGRPIILKGDYAQCPSGASLVIRELRRPHPRNPNTYTYSETEANGLQITEGDKEGKVDITPYKHSWISGEYGAWRLPNKTIKSFKVELLLGNSSKRYSGELVSESRNHEFTDFQKQLILNRYLISPSNVPTSYKYASGDIPEDEEIKIILKNSEGKTLEPKDRGVVTQDGDFIRLHEDEAAVGIFCSEDKGLIHIRHVNLLMPRIPKTPGMLDGVLYPTAVLITDLQVKASKVPTKKEIDF